MAQDRPTASELVEAVIEYLERDVMPIEGRVGFHGRVARNVLAIVRRELELGDDLDAAERERLADLLADSDPNATTADLEAELSREIRAGHLDGRLGEVADAVRATVRGKLDVSNPEYSRD